MPSPSKYTVTNVNLVLDTIKLVSISDKDLRRKISEITELIHPLALRQFIKSMEDLDYIEKSLYPGEEIGYWMIKSRDEDEHDESG